MHAIRLLGLGTTHTWLQEHGAARGRGEQRCAHARGDGGVPDRGARGREQSQQEGVRSATRQRARRPRRRAYNAVLGVVRSADRHIYIYIWLQVHGAALCGDERPHRRRRAAARRWGRPEHQEQRRAFYGRVRGDRKK